MAMSRMKCSICGGFYFDDDMKELGLGGLEVVFRGKQICPDCKRAQAMSGGKSGAASNKDVRADVAAAKAAQAAAEAEKAKIEAEEERKRREEIERKEEAHKQAIRQIKEFVFPEDDAEFSRAVNTLIDDYLDCTPGFFDDGDYKKAYQKRMEMELKILKDSNPTRYEKLNALWTEAYATMKQKLKIRLIISGGLFAASTIFFGIGFALSGSNFFEGLLVGLTFGAILGFIPQKSFKSKTDKE